MSEVTRINMELCRALGVDTANVSRVVLVIDAGQWPTLQITKHADSRTADGLHTAVHMLELKPVPQKK